MTPSLAVFCDVIDNYGDAGVAWRLVAEWQRRWPSTDIVLYINQPSLVERLAPGQQGIRVADWPAAKQAAELVVELFGCRIPAPYLLAMVHKKSRWVNIDYLSAEAWVEGCHGLRSPHPNHPLSAVFFYPGFTNKTGGLIREQSLPLVQHQEETIKGVFVFSYPTPLRDCLSSQVCLFAERDLAFVPQAQFDAVLREHQFNIVRGEDSFVRAQFAARPFLWHIYPQTEDSHLLKLTAFLDAYLQSADCKLAAYISALSLAWNKQDVSEFKTLWDQLNQHYPAWQSHANHWAAKLFAQTDLLSNLAAMLTAPAAR
jgi:hypothetical protein